MLRRRFSGDVSRAMVMCGYCTTKIDIEYSGLVFEAMMLTEMLS